MFVYEREKQSDSEYAYVCLCAYVCVSLCSLAQERQLSVCVCGCTSRSLCLFSKVQQRGSCDQHHPPYWWGERFPRQPRALVSGRSWGVQPRELCHEHQPVCQWHHLHVQTRYSVMAAFFVVFTPHRSAGTLVNCQKTKGVTQSQIWEYRRNGPMYSLVDTQERL